MEIEAKPHDALGDIQVVEGLFGRLYAKIMEDDGLEDPVQEMVRISSNPILIARMPFGKHKGALMSEVPLDYLEWLQTIELDEDMAFTVKRHLKSF
jgi:exodeoxyribonuclease X